MKLSLFLTKYHTMKTYPLLNYVPRSGNVLGSRGIAPRILDLGIRWKVGGQLHAPATLPPEKEITVLIG